jgi:hypothetical protein
MNVNPVAGCDNHGDRRSTMRLSQSIHQLVITAAVLFIPPLALAQAPPTTATSASPPAKSSVKVDMVPSLFVMNARGAALST